MGSSRSWPRRGSPPCRCAEGEARMAAENSFDIACKIDPQEVTNALDQARREIGTRYDLKGSKNELRLEANEIVVLAADDMKLKAVVDILQSRLHKRGVPLKALTYGEVEQAAGGVLRQKIALQQGIPIERAKEIVRLIKDSKIRGKRPSRRTRSAWPERTATIFKRSSRCCGTRISASR